MTDSASAPRRAGILLHPTSLPGPWGIGDFGPAAWQFLDWAKRAGLSVWQVLPLGPTSYGNSPYGALSAFAGNPWLVSPEKLAEDGLLPRPALETPGALDPRHMDSVAVRAAKEPLLRRAHEHFTRFAPRGLRAAAEEWSAAPEQAFWLEDWATFAALKARLGEKEWTTWDAPLRHREPAALTTARRELVDEIDFHRFVQFAFFRQFAALRQAAAERAIEILGDLPIYVAGDSADVWSHPELFRLDEAGLPTVVAGVPPDYFSATGQRWGNPLYDWRRMADQGFRWWVERLRANLRLADVVRLDHFRGFAAYWEIPASEPTAVRGRWVKGPGRALFEALRQGLGGLPLVAEDLGVITPDVRALRDELGLPGMKVLQFGVAGFDSDHAPHHCTARSVVYTGTHDNDTARGWFESLPEADRGVAREYLGDGGHGIAWDLVRAAYTSVGEIAIVPAQDFFGLGSEARMNTPGEGRGNWEWRARAEDFTGDLAERLIRLAALAGRLPSVAAAKQEEIPEGYPLD